MASFFCSFSDAPSSSSSSSSNPNVLLKEEIIYENINRSIDNWKIPEHPTSNIYQTSKRFLIFDYTIKTVKQTIHLHSEYEEIKLLSRKTIEKHTKKLIIFILVSCKL